MNREEIESKFIDLVDGTLPTEEEQELLEKINSEPTLKKSFEDFKGILELETVISKEEHSIHENFVVKVMEKVERPDPGYFKRLIMNKLLSKRQTIGALGTVFVTAFLVIGSLEFMGTKIENKFMSISAVIPHEEVGYNQPGRQYADLRQTFRDSAGEFGKDGKKSKSFDKNSTRSIHVPKGVADDMQAHQLNTRESYDKMVEKIKKQKRREAPRNLGFGLSGGDYALGSSASGSSPRKGESKLERFGDLKKPRSAPVDAINGAMASGSDKFQLEKRSLTASKAKAGKKKWERLVEKSISGATQHSVISAVGRSKSLRDEMVVEEKEVSAGQLFFERQAEKLLKKNSRYGNDVLPQPFQSRIDSYQQPAYNNERYGEWEENTRTFVSTEAISTFSIDVDTGSYTNARRFLKAGSFPPPNSVRIEEYLNYFDYNYPVQMENPFTLSYEIAPNPLDTDRHLLKIGIKAKDPSDATEQAWNLVFLVDVSGSMSSANKLGLVKSALKLLVNKMRVNDRIAIVTYAGRAGTVLEPTGINNKQRILNAIDAMRSGGSTHGSAGINQAYNLAERFRISAGVNRVILATDGDFNVGVTSQAALIRLIEAKRRSGITLTTLGFGTGNIKESMMEQLANKGNGNYYYIDNFSEARKVFETDLAGTMQVVAKDVKLQIEFNPAHVARYRLIGYENRKLRKQDFNNDTIDAGEIGAGHTVTALYEIDLVGGVHAKESEVEYRYQRELNKKETPKTEAHSPELAFLKIRFKKPQGDKSDLLRFPILKEHVLANSETASDDFRFAASVSAFAHILRRSEFAGSYSLRNVIDVAEDALGKDKHGYRREFIELVKNVAAMERR